jgi:hypothetical protein
VLICSLHRRRSSCRCVEIKSPRLNLRDCGGLRASRRRGADDGGRFAVLQIRATLNHRETEAKVARLKAEVDGVGGGRFHCGGRARWCLVWHLFTHGL